MEPHLILQMKERRAPILILADDACCPSFFTVPVFRSSIRPGEGDKDHHSEQKMERERERERQRVRERGREKGSETERGRERNK